jgi:hypothetical protein
MFRRAAPDDEREGQAIRRASQQGLAAVAAAIQIDADHQPSVLDVERRKRLEQLREQQFLVPGGDRYDYGSIGSQLCYHSSSTLRGATWCAKIWECTRLTYVALCASG